jgi:hypothetical protein
MKLVFISKHFVGYTNGSSFLCFPTIIGFMGSYKKLSFKLINIIMFVQAMNFLATLLLLLMLKENAIW